MRMNALIITDSLLEIAEMKNHQIGKIKEKEKID